MRKVFGIKRSLVAVVAAVCALGGAVAVAAAHGGAHKSHTAGGSTRTPIKHLVIIFQENVSFDHTSGRIRSRRILPGSDSSGTITSA